MAWHGKRLGELVAMLQREFGEHHYGRVVDLTLRSGQAEHTRRSYGFVELIGLALAGLQDLSEVLERIAHGRRRQIA